MTIKNLPLLALTALLLLSITNVHAYEQNQDETAITFGLSAERGWRDWSASYIKYRGVVLWGMALNLHALHTMMTPLLMNTNNATMNTSFTSLLV